MRRLVLRREAAEEMESAAAWYAERSESLSGEFLHAVDAAIARVQREPLQCAVVDGELRHYVLRRFPYRLIFTCSDDEIVLLAIAHWRQDPLVWSERH